MTTSTADRLQAVLAGLPAGRWVSCADLAAALGEPPSAARGLNQRLIRHQPPNAHRVLKGDGRIAPTALGDPDLVRDRLAADEVPFVGGVAAPDTRYVPAPLAADPSSRQALWDSAAGALVAYAADGGDAVAPIAPALDAFGVARAVAAHEPSLTPDPES